LLEEEREQPTSRVWIGVVLVFLVLFGFFLWQMGGLEAFLKWYQGGKPQVAETQPSDGAAGTTPATAANPTPESQTPSTPAESPKPETTPAKEEPKQESAPEPKKTEETPAPPEPKPEVKKAPPPPKPRPQPVVARPVRPAPVASDPVTECDRRLSFLRAGDSRGEAGATAQLGTMYYEGRCVARDLPTAYRLYARALHKDPNNSQIADTIANIWKQMSPAERQLAIKPQ
jgi:cytoskeletal protein RodZ